MTPSTRSLDRSGNFVMPGLSWARARAIRLDPGFDPRFAGHLYAQPLYWQPPGATSGELIVATESNTVHAVDARTGRILWTRALGRPAQLATQPCGNIDPLGITGTPVYDPGTGLVYAVAETTGFHHMLAGISVSSGKLRFLRDIPTPDGHPRADQQRAALAVAVAPSPSTSTTWPARPASLIKPSPG